MLTHAPTIPDLLHPVPGLRIDRETTRVAIALAFAGSTSGGLFSEALERAQVTPSHWDPDAFAKDLFLSRFVNDGFRIRIGPHEPSLCTGHLLRLLASPPADPSVVQFRRSLLWEVAESPALRRSVEQLYLSLCKLRGQLENVSGQRNWDPNRRQLDILALFKDIIDRCAEDFRGAQHGVQRLAEFGSRVQSLEPYQSLSDLLRYDSRLATLDLRVSVGADGRIRGFEIVSVDENQKNPFSSSPLKRWLARLELFLRGYSLGEGEVMARLIDAVFSGIEEEMIVLVQLLGDLEFYLGSLGFRDRAHEKGLAMCLPELVDADQPREILGLFNPLLLMSGTEPVPCDIVTARLASTTLITGPNSGGKTRLLQSLALTQLLAQCGLFVPARAAKVGWAPALVVSLIEETRADQAEGRLGMELMRIRKLFEELPPGAMVLLDELCSGTNPSEGEEIFELVVTTLAPLKPQVFITTHFLTFSARLKHEGKIPHLGFLQVELGADRRATFQFRPGVAETSLAGHAAERLGVTGEQLMALVERNLKRFAGSPSQGLN